jgi:hypothetical protein
MAINLVVNYNRQYNSPYYKLSSAKISLMHKFKKLIVLSTLSLTLATAFYSVPMGIYFGVLTNVLINVFWTSNLFERSPKSKKTSLGFSQHTEKKVVARRPAL